MGVQRRVDAGSGHCSPAVRQDSDSPVRERGAVSATWHYGPRVARRSGGLAVRGVGAASSSTRCRQVWIALYPPGPMAGSSDSPGPVDRTLHSTEHYVSGSIRERVRLSVVAYMFFNVVGSDRNTLCGREW